MVGNSISIGGRKDGVAIVFGFRAAGQHVEALSKYRLSLVPLSWLELRQSL